MENSSQQKYTLITEKFKLHVSDSKLTIKSKGQKGLSRWGRQHLKVVLTKNSRKETDLVVTDIRILYKPTMDLRIYNKESSFSLHP